MFSNTEVRDDGLPLLYLHNRECWNRTGHVCPDLPPSASENLEEDLDLDYDFYHPKKHGMIGRVVMRDMGDAFCL